MTFDELERLERAATPGNWHPVPMGFNVGEDGLCIDPVGTEVHPYADVVAKVGVLGVGRSARQVWADARLIAAARNALPALLRVARASQTYCVAVRPAPLAGEDCTDELVALDAALAALEAIQ